MCLTHTIVIIYYIGIVIKNFLLPTTTRYSLFFSLIFLLLPYASNPHSIVYKLTKSYCIFPLVFYIFVTLPNCSLRI